MHLGKTQTDPGLVTTGPEKQHRLVEPAALSIRDTSPTRSMGLA